MRSNAAQVQLKVFLEIFPLARAKQIITPAALSIVQVCPQGDSYREKVMSVL
jgi:hypothetical protein